MASEVYIVERIPKKLGELYKFLVSELESLPQIVLPQEKAEIILEIVLNRKLIDVIVSPEDSVTPAQVERIAKVLCEVSRGKPLAYALGEWFFANKLFFVNQAVMIPRPDTETLLQVASDYLEHLVNAKRIRRPRVLEIGVGAGALIISIADRFAKAEAYGTDISIEAIKTARKNAMRHKITNLRLYRGDLFTAFPKEMRFNLVVSNPPYVGITEEVDELVALFEPKEAIYVPEGMESTFYHKRIISEAPRRLYPWGMVALEVGLGQSQEVKRLMEEAGLADVRSYKDLANNERVVSGVWQES